VVDIDDVFASAEGSFRSSVAVDFKIRIFSYRVGAGPKIVVIGVAASETEYSFEERRASAT
jgi:hypothetical protein